jgi:DNA-damage-inducible protein J
MNKSATVSIRVAPELKAGAESVFQKLGISPTDAITMFYSQVNLRQGIPFPIEIPNAVTMKAIEDADAGLDIHKANSIDDLFSEIGV